MFVIGSRSLTVSHQQLSPGSLALRTQREGRDVRAVFIGQLHNYFLPMRRGHSWWWVVGGGGGGDGGGQTICYVVQYSTVLEHQWSCCGGQE